MTGGDAGRLGPHPDAAERLQRATESLRMAGRRQDGRQSAIGPRAEKTRRKLMDSATHLFHERGYVATSVSDIAEDADVSLATFYQYFAERNDIVAALAAEVIREMLKQGVDRWDPRTGRLGLRRVVAPFVAGYARHAEFFELWQCATHVDDRMRSLYRDYNGSYQQQFFSYLTAGIDAGLVRSDLDPAGMARAMTLMVERYCYEVFVLDPPEPTPSPEEVTDLLTTLWADAIDLTETDERPRRPARPPRDRS